MRRRLVPYGALAVAIAAATLHVLPSREQVIAGRAAVIDGDSLTLDGRRLRLEAIDAPELAQDCERNGVAWACGEAAATALRRLIGNREVTCRWRERDRYRRLVARCATNGVDLNRAMVESGFALAYRRHGQDYVDAEDEARRARRGVWSGSFTPPWDWRPAHPRSG